MSKHQNIVYKTNLKLEILMRKITRKSRKVNFFILHWSISI